MAFQGSLDELPLPDIIQLVAVSGKTGVFELTRGSREGQIYLRDGQIVHARTSRLEGDEAVYELATWNDGEFSFTQGVDASAKTIDKSNTNLLMEAARRMDEWKILAKKIPSTAHIPVFVSSKVNTSVSFSPHEWAIVSRVDGRRSIEDIALSLGQSPFETCKNLYGLLTSGLLELREDLFRPPPSRLRRASIEELEALLPELDAAARAALQGTPTESTLDGASSRARDDIGLGRGIDAVVDLVRTHEEAISRLRGADHVGQYLAQIRRILGSHQGSRTDTVPAV